MRRGILPGASDGAGAEIAGSSVGGGGAGGTVTMPPQVLQVAFRPANASGTEKERPQPGQLKLIINLIRQTAGPESHQYQDRPAPGTMPAIQMIIDAISMRG